MAKTFSLTSVQDSVAVATTLTQSWFRGHMRAVDQLTPRVFRPEFDDEMVRGFRPAFELEMIERFKQDAPTLTEGRPAESDYLGWLCLMQHYRAPSGRSGRVDCTGTRPRADSSLAPTWLRSATPHAAAAAVREAAPTSP
jgi:hypothetical protein